GLGDGFALQRLGHEGGGSQRNGTAVALEADFGDPLVFHMQIHAESIAAQRVVAVRFMARRFEFAEIARTFVVVDDDVLVQGGEFVVHHWQNTLRAAIRETASRSTSSCVLYRPNEARAVAG